jgi:type II secretory pathway pseudopilin PulG
MEKSPRIQPGGSGHAFTLLEVILALSIAAGMLAVVLYFYKQAEQLRVQLLQETSRLTAARLLLERLTVELGQARRCDVCEQSLRGGPNSIQFLKLELPTVAGWTNSRLSTLGGSLSLFHLISYSVSASATDTNVLGLARTEESLLKRAVVLTSTNGTEAASTNASLVRTPPLFTEDLHFLRFRYWDGTAWQDSWSAAQLPSGVEVTVGAEPLPPESSIEDYPGELYRRVIFVPQHTTNAPPMAVDVVRSGP